MSAANKDIIYIDIDDEITSIIEKVQGAEHKIAALVLPKRASVLQSVVNMKLLKRSADEAGKSIVLITSEAGLMPLAGAVGLHVAKTLQTKPMIPTAPKIYDGNAVADDDVPVESGGDEPELDASKPIGFLAGLRGGRSDEEETIEVDNSDEVEEPIENPVKKHNKKLRVPNFNKFRTRLILGGAGLVLLLIFWYFAAFVMPKAKIVIKTDTTSETANVTFSTDPALTELNTEEMIVPVVIEEVKKTDTEKATATGTKDNGTKATGTITIRNCDYKDGFSISAGSSFTGGGKIFVSTERVDVPEYTSDSSSECTLGGSGDGTATVKVQAQAAGESYNVSSTSYTVPGIPSGRKVDSVGSAMTGGTTKVVKILSQKDFDDASTKLADRIETSQDVSDELRETLESKGYYAITDSMITGIPEITSSPKVGEEATEATLTSSITYTMYGVKEDDLKALIRDSVDDAVDDAQEMIQTTGLSEATVRMTSKAADGKGAGTIQSIVVIGPRLDLDNLKKEIAGKKKGNTLEILKNKPGVVDVSVDYSPFWVFSTPGKTGKISITLEQANTSDD